jgi:hypothetical protein
VRRNPNIDQAIRTIKTDQGGSGQFVSVHWHEHGPCVAAAKGRVVAESRLPVALPRHWRITK